jgi:hypothetical protein
MKVSQATIIELMREEYDTHLRSVIKELTEKPVDDMANPTNAEDQGDAKKSVQPKEKEPRVQVDKISIETRVTHMPKSGARGYEYTVVNIDHDTNEVELRAGDGSSSKIDIKKFETEYVVD